MLKITPLGNRVLIKRIREDQEEKLSSGIYISQEKKSSSKNQGIVEAIGPELEKKAKEGNLHFKKGDRVLFSWGDSFEDGDTTYDIISENNVLAVLTEVKEK